MGKILVGTCNWSDFEHFYPRGLKPNERLGYYARYFPLVEVDSTFYRLMPRARTSSCGPSGRRTTSSSTSRPTAR